MTRQEIPESIYAYVRQRLLLRLGYGQRQFSLVPVKTGIHSRVFCLDIEGEQPLILKSIPKRKRLCSIIRCSWFLAQKGVSVPDIIDAYEDNRFFNRRGIHILCETMICGETLQKTERSPELIRSIARFFSRMHAVTRETWGGIDKSRRTGLFAYLHEKTEQRMANWIAADASVSASLQKKIRATFAREKVSVDHMALYSLSHCDPNPGNIILRSSDRKLFLLDPGTIRFMPRAIEYYMLCGFFCLNNTERERLFEAAYMHGLSRHEREDFMATHLFFKLYVLILFMCDFATKFPALSHDSPYYEECITLMPLLKRSIMELVESRR